MFHSLNLVWFQWMCLIWFVFLYKVLHWNPPTPSFYIKNISKECIYFHASAASGPASYRVSHEQTVKGSSKSSGTFPPTVGGECLVNNRNEKKKITGVSFVSLFFCLDFFLFFSIWNKKKKQDCWRKQRAERTAVIQRGARALGHVVVLGLGRGGRAGDWSAPLFFTRCCCCSPSPYIECPLRCSLCQGAEPRTCPHTSRCPVYVHEMACTARQKSMMNVWTSSKNLTRTSDEVIRGLWRVRPTHLLALKESFSVTVGKVQGQGHHAGSVLHSLDDPIQFPPAWALVEKHSTSL